MKTRAVRLYGESDLRLEEFDMGELKDDEILMELITDSVCMSTYKESIQGAKHQRVNDDISEHPIIVGHEFAGIIREVGAKWKDKYQVGTKYTMQPAINIKGSMAAIGYSYVAREVERLCIRERIPHGFGVYLAAAVFAHGNTVAYG